MKRLQPAGLLEILCGIGSTCTYVSLNNVTRPILPVGRAVVLKALGLPLAGVAGETSPCEANGLGCQTSIMARIERKSFFGELPNPPRALSPIADRRMGAPASTSMDSVNLARCAATAPFAGDRGRLPHKQKAGRLIGGERNGFSKAVRTVCDGSGCRRSGSFLMAGYWNQRAYSSPFEIEDHNLPHSMASDAKQVNPTAGVHFVIGLKECSARAEL
jgi:hypothetical protein